MNLCQICSSEKMQFIDSRENYLFCRKCRTVFYLNQSNPEYSDTYFTTDYRKQYGKTYAEDYDAIYKFSQTRISRIEKILPEKIKKSSLLEIGCALGFFLKAASDRGFRKCSGIEISSYASEYARKNFGLKIENIPYSEYSISDKFDVICAWYYFEHERNVPEVIQKTAGRLKKNGVLAFSIPCTNGPMFLLNREQWIKSHPEDHSMDFSPQSVRMLLRKSGFGKIRIYPAGIHPERVFKRTLFLFPVLKFLYGIYSRLFKFSDTIEVYALKK